MPPRTAPRVLDPSTLVPFSVPDHVEHWWCSCGPCARRGEGEGRSPGCWLPESTYKAHKANRPPDWRDLPCMWGKRVLKTGPRPHAGSEAVDFGHDDAPQAEGDNDYGGMDLGELVYKDAPMADADESDAGSARRDERGGAGQDPPIIIGDALGDDELALEGREDRLGQVDISDTDSLSEGGESRTSAHGDDGGEEPLYVDDDDGGAERYEAQDGAAAAAGARDGEPEPFIPLNGTHLSLQDLIYLLFYRVTTEFHCSDKLFKALIWVFGLMGIEISSRYVMKGMVHKALDFEVVEIDTCPRTCGLFYGKDADASRCRRCGAQRYKKTAKGLKPAATTTYRPLEAYARALHANLETSNEILESGTRLLAQRGDPPALIRDWHDGLLAQRLMQLVPDIQPYDLILAGKSDGTEVLVERQKVHKLSLYVFDAEALSLPISKRFKPMYQYPLFTAGPKHVVDLSSFLEPVVDDAKLAAAGFPIYVAALGEVKLVRVFFLQWRGDTIEQKALAGIAPPTARCSCIWCCHEGSAVGSAYYPHHYSLVQGPPGAPAQPVDPTRRDSVLVRPDPAAPTSGLEPLKYRSAAQLNAVNQRLEQPNITQTEVERVTLVSGVVGRAPLRHMPLFLDNFPHNLCYDIMHGDDINGFKELMRLLVEPSTGPPILPTCACGPQIDQTLLAAMSKAFEIGQAFLPTSITPFSRDLLEKMSRYHAREWKSLELYGMASLLANVEFADDTAMDAVVAFIRLRIMSEYTTIDRSAPSEGVEPDLITLADSGEQVIALATLKEVQMDCLTKRELAFFRRDPRFLATCKPTLHRGSHRGEATDQNGPLKGQSAASIEGLIGHIKSSARSKIHIIKEASNNLTRAVTVLFLNLVYSLPSPPKPEPRPESTLGSPFLPDTHLLSPKRALLCDDEIKGLVKYWEREKVSPASVDAVRVWGRVRLETGTTIRSSLMDGGEVLMVTQQEQVTWQASLGRKAGPAARFVWCTDSDGRTYFAECLAFVSLECKSRNGQLEEQPRLLAVVSIFPTARREYGFLPVFSRGAPREVRVVGIEELRMPIGLMPLVRRGDEDEDEELGIVWKRGARGTAFRSGKVYETAS